MISEVLESQLVPFQRTQQGARMLAIQPLSVDLPAQPLAGPNR